jgi:hypothetical protein
LRDGKKMVLPLHDEIQLQMIAREGEVCTHACVWTCAYSSTTCPAWSSCVAIHKRTHFKWMTWCVCDVMSCFRARPRCARRWVDHRVGASTYCTNLIYVHLGAP